MNKIAVGEVDLAFRWWKRPTVKSGGRLRTEIGELSIVDVGVVRFESLNGDEAKRAGYTSLESLKTDLAPQSDRELYKIKLRFSGEDIRRSLRENAALPAAQFAELIADLERIDARMGVPGLSIRTLALIARHPEKRAQELADALGFEKQPFKSFVRKLKERGLTESLSVGYRLSPRGQRVLTLARGSSSS
ncbi:MAG: hypothetical protein AAFX39_14700 [Pseudomonadota bacterium]